MSAPTSVPSEAVANVLLAALPQLIERRDLTRDQARAAMEEILSGAATPAQIGAFIVALRMSPNERDRFRRAAKKQGKTFAAWARDVMNAAAKGTK